MKSIIDREWMVSFINVVSRSRKWYMREYLRIDATPQNYNNELGIHPVVYQAMLTHQATSWHQVMLELPHVATDGVRVAYTRDDEHGEQDRQTVTSVGKYIKRHWSYLRDDVIRDLVALYSPSSCEYKILDESTDQFISYLKRSADSCMNKDSFVIHPYHVYCPSLGWKFAVRLDENGDVLGRALVNDGEFVRSYSKNRGWGADVELEAWLQSSGFSRVDDWDGKSLKLIQHGKNYVAPYVDGCIRAGNVKLLSKVITICVDGEYELDNVSGFAREIESEECNDCGDRCDEDDLVNAYDGGRICEDCAGNNYVWSNYSENFVHNDNAVYIEANNRYLHEDDVDNAGYIYIESCGEYIHQDNCIYCESNGEYFHEDDISKHNIVMVEDGSHENEYWYIDNTVTTRDGVVYHSDDIDNLVVIISLGNDEGEFVEISEATKTDDGYILNEGA